jgi:hypothetical protein
MSLSQSQRYNKTIETRLRLKSCLIYSQLLNFQISGLEQVECQHSLRHIKISLKHLQSLTMITRVAKSLNP